MELRPFQLEALKHLERPIHLICESPTGSGKSLIFESRGRYPGTRTLIVSPLVALARQQCDRLNSIGLRATCGAGPNGESPPKITRTRSGAWIVSPEKFFAPERPATLEILRQWHPNFLVVDECHCLWDWGKDFRPAFDEIPQLISRFTIERSLWLTATLPTPAREELLSRLPINSRSIGGFALPNDLSLKTFHLSATHRPQFLAQWLARHTSSGIIFVHTRAATTRVAHVIDALGRTRVAYHGGMSSEERRILETQVSQRKDAIIVSTSAFGMGMHYPHLEWALLWQPPLSPISFAQSIGRAGRGASAGEAVVLWDHEDFRSLEWTLAGSQRKRDDLIAIYRILSGQTNARAALETLFEKNPVAFDKASKVS